MSYTGHSTGHSRALRLILKKAREDAGLSARAVGELIATHLAEQGEEDVRAVAENTVYAWEGFRRHPSIAMYAAWARVLGFRLDVSLDSASEPRKKVLVRSDDAAEAARRVDGLPADKRATVMQMIRLVAPD